MEKLLNIPFIKKIPFIRRYYFKYLKNWATINNNREVEINIIHNIKMKLTIKDWVQYNLFIYGKYEENETLLWEKLVKKSSVILDIGANVGYFSLLASKINPKSSIFSFEPIKHTFDRLSYNVKQNNFQNIKLFNCAISDENRILSINVGNENNWGMSSVNNHEFTSGKIENINAISIDNFVKEEKIQRVDLIKLDIEGAEYMALEGMKNTLDNYSPDILIEILDEHLLKQNKSSEMIYNLLFSKGYVAFSIENNGVLKRLLTPISKDGLIYFTKEK
jgi:FkbM family methyltransferase